jgi:hypothetical protein
MEIKIFYIIWVCLDLTGLLLMTCRSDVDKFRNEAHFIMTKGTFAHKITYVLIAIVLLPLTIPRSIQEFLRK